MASRKRGKRANPEPYTDSEGVCPECCNRFKSPMTTEMWKVFSDPITSISTNLNESSSDLQWLLKTLLRCAREMSDMFIPRDYSHRSKKTYRIREEQYKAFATWMFGRVFYINGRLCLKSLHALGIDLQVKWMKSIEFENNHMYTSLLEEYVLVLEDMLLIKKYQPEFKKYTLRRFTPSILSIDGELKLLPKYVEVQSEDVAERITETVLKILEELIIDGDCVTEKIFMDALRVVLESMRVWGLSVQAAVVQLMTTLMRSEMNVQNKEVWDNFFYQMNDLITVRIPHYSTIIVDRKVFKILVESIIDLFTEVDEGNHFNFNNNSFLLEMVWRFSLMECINVFPVKRMRLICSYSYAMLLKVPLELVKDGLMKTKPEDMDGFLESIHLLEVDLRINFLISFKKFLNDSKDIVILEDEEDRYAVPKVFWSVKENIPAWRPFLKWFEIFSSSENVKSEQIPDIISLTSCIVEIATKLSYSLEEELLVSPVGDKEVEISFFDDVIKQVFETYVNILLCLDDDVQVVEESVSYYLEMFEAIGNLLTVSSYRHNAHKKNGTAIAMLSLPWTPEEYPLMGLIVPRYVCRQLANSIPIDLRARLQCISLSFLFHTSKNTEFSYRCHILERAIRGGDENVVIKAIEWLPFYLITAVEVGEENKLVSALKDVLSDKLAVQLAIAKIMTNFICIMCGQGEVRYHGESFRSVDIGCEICDPESSLVALPMFDRVYNVINPLFELFNSEHSEVRVNMATAVRSMAKHIKFRPCLLSKCLQLLQDSDDMVRSTVAEYIDLLAYPVLIIVDVPLSERKERFDLVYSSVFGVVKYSLRAPSKDLQETTLQAIKSLGRVPWDYAVFPVLKLLIIYLIHPSSSISNASATYFIEFCKSRNISPAQMYAKYRAEICTLIFATLVLSLSESRVSFSTYVRKVASLFELGSPYDFLQGNLQYILPPLIPFITSSGNVNILVEISFFLSTTTDQLLLNHFRHIYSHLYLNEDTEVFQKCMEFIRRYGKLDVTLLKKLSAEAIQNQLILHLYLKPEKVMSGLAEFIEERSSSKPISRDDVADLLQPRILGILLFLDSIISAPTACHTKKEQALSCLPELIRFMGPKRLTPIKFKIMGTLKTCLRLEEEDYLRLTCNAWEAFVENVELASLGSLLSQIFVSLLPLLEKFPDKISSIFNFLVIENKVILKDYICDLYFVPKHNAIEDVYLAIQRHLREHWPTDFRTCLAKLHKYITHNHVEVKLNALKKLRLFLKTNKEELNNFVLNFAAEDFILSELIETLIIGCRDRDPRVKIACGECFGELGAIDSARLPQDTSQKDEKEFIFDIRDEGFAVEALTKFLGAFMSARDTADMDRFAFAIQVFLKEYLNTLPNESRKAEFWEKFSPDMRQIMKPFKSTRYMLSSEVDEPWKPHPIYGSAAGTSFQAWAYKWVCSMMTIEKDKFKLEILSACRGCLKVDMNVVIFLLPHIFVNAVIEADEEQSWKLVEEVMAVITSPSIDPKKNKFTEGIMPIRIKSHATAESHTDSPQEMRVMCLNTVFSLIDYLAMWVREWHVKFDIKEGQKDKRPFIIKLFLNKICKLTIANKNFECREYPRALQYLEQYVQEQPQALEKQYHFFEKIYARLNDPDAVAGVLAVQEKPPTFEQLILSHEANGQWQDAATCYEKMAQSGCPETGYAMGMVNCYLKLDQPHAALGLIEGLSSVRPELDGLFNEYYHECLMKMGDWDQLRERNKLEHDNTTNLWNVSIGSALLNLKVENKFRVPKIDSMREALMSSLCAISIDKGAYERGYQFIIRSQILNEIERATEIMENLKWVGSREGENIIEKLLSEWDIKLKSVCQSTATLEQILSVRRMILSIIHQHYECESRHVSKVLNNGIGSLWIESATTARNSGYFQQSYMYLLNAEKIGLKNVFVEKAKLFWEKNDSNLAISTLRKGIGQTFPDAAQYKVLKDAVPLNDRKICAEAKLLFAHFNDKNINADIDQNLFNYKDSVETYQKCEKNLVYLAQYYDRILDAIISEDEDKGRDAQLHMINYFGKSLEFGCQYMYHSIPRMLTIWLDYGAKLIKRKESDNDIFVKMTKLIETYSGRLPIFMFFSAFSQIITRLCHPHPLVYNTLRNIITKIITTYPHQSLWMIMAVYKSSNAVLSRKCGEIFSMCKKKDKNVSPIINDYIKLTDLLITLCNRKFGQGGQTTTIARLVPALQQMLRSDDRCKLSLPLQKLINITMPLNPDSSQMNHNPFPWEPVYISGIDDKVYIFTSLKKPKRIVFRGSDGNQYPLICKSEDDLRKDLRVMEFNRIVNSFLRSDAEASQRCLHVRTYSVVPLNDNCGVIECVPNLIGLRSLLSQIYAKMGKTTTTSELKKMMCALHDSLQKKKAMFLDKLIPKHPPVFDTWFYRNFSDPQSWYMARNAYVRTTAVMSIVGYVLGLGDRHGENVLFDSRNGDTVHVDLSCIFNAGEKFTWPERVPFRLTHNMVKAMGSNGIEGIFRRSCEITMKILKRESSTLIAVLTPFVYDPTMSSRGGSDCDSQEITSKEAQVDLQNIKQRLQGYVNTKGGKFSLPLSTEGQVEKLISEATNVDNLCQMYLGWGAYL